MNKILKKILDYLRYIKNYNLNTLTMAKLQYENENYKELLEYEGTKFNEQNEVLKFIEQKLKTYKKRISFLSPEIEEIKKVVEENTQKKMSDEIFEHFTSDN